MSNRTCKRKGTWTLTDSIHGPPLVTDVDDLSRLGHDVLRKERVTAVLDLVVEERVVADVDPSCSERSDVSAVVSRAKGAATRTLVDAVLREEVAGEF